MTCKPRPISGNLPFDAIAKDYNRYCGRIVGGVLPGGSSVIDINTDGNIIITFSEAVQPATVTNTSPAADGTGSFELFNETQAEWVNGALSTPDNIQWTFDPTVNFTIGDELTLHLGNTILTVVGSNPYEGPFEFNYKVVASAPVAPTLDSVTPGNAKNTIVFTDNDTSDSFDLSWGTASGVLTNTIVGVVSPYDHTGLTNSTEYFYEVVAIKDGIESIPSLEDSGTPIAPFIVETFTAVNGTLIQNHLADTGEAWSNVLGITEIQGNKAVAGLATVDRANISNLPTGVGDHTVSANMTFSNAIGRTCGLLFRYANIDNFLQLGVGYTNDAATGFQDAARWSLFKWVSGTPTQIGTSWDDILQDDGHVYAVSVVSLGLDHTVIIDGVERFNENVTNITTSTDIGMRLVPDTSFDSGLQSIDNIEVSL